MRYERIFRNTPQRKMYRQIYVVGKLPSPALFMWRKLREQLRSDRAGALENQH
jgi:hypothetical protein